MCLVDVCEDDWYALCMDDTADIELNKSKYGANIAPKEQDDGANIAPLQHRYSIDNRIYIRHKANHSVQGGGKIRPQNSSTRTVGLSSPKSSILVGGRILDFPRSKSRLDAAGRADVVPM